MAELEIHYEQGGRPDFSKAAKVTAGILALGAAFTAGMFAGATGRSSSASEPAYAKITFNGKAVDCTKVSTSIGVDPGSRLVAMGPEIYACPAVTR